MIFSFSDDVLNDIRTPNNDPLVVNVNISNHFVGRVLVDNESLTNMLSYETFNKMNIPLEELKLIQSPLVGFTGNVLNPKGVISFLVTVGEKPCWVTIFVNFLVVKMLGTYNTILRRPTQCALKAVVSIPHMKMKFPTPCGMGEVKGNPSNSWRMVHDFFETCKEDHAH
ncbi:hypothetical protein CFOL_v3_02760 [Cephalotus follicularis]|uniref:Uncharacterized protein n=1 Tax=Cephalotus follicularis TaxID=3775 RepID=A0A1Q3AU40_CEPFO|nr:hypothetical protein CFOL_v3_02760 [Cephalotus follicularis]